MLRVEEVASLGPFSGIPEHAIRALFPFQPSHPRHQASGWHGVGFQQQGSVQEKRAPASKQVLLTAQETAIVCCLLCACPYNRSPAEGNCIKGPCASVHMSSGSEGSNYVHRLEITGNNKGAIVGVTNAYLIMSFHEASMESISK